MNSFKSRNFTFFILLFILPIILIFIYFFIYYKLTFDIETVLLSFKNNYIFLSSLNSSFSLTVYIFIFYIILNFNVLNSIEMVKSKIASINQKQIYNSFFIIFSIVFLFIFILNEFISPSITKKIENMKLITNLSYTYLKLAKLAEKNKNFVKSIEYYQKYLFFEPTNQEIADKITDLKREKYIYHGKKKSETNEGKKIDVQGLYSKGLYYFNKKEYLLSAYYLEKYLELITTDEKAKSLYKKALELYEKNKTTVNKINKEKLNLKAKGIELLKQKKYVEAYKIFKYLKNKYPADKSILGYYLEAKKLYEQLDFLIDRAEELKNFPGTFDIVYIIKDENNRDLIFYSQKIVNYFDQIFFYNIKLYDIKNGKMSYYKYGKQVGSYLIVKNVEYKNKKFKDNFDFNKLSNLFLIGNQKYFSIPFYFRSINYYRSIGYNVKIIQNSLIKRIVFYLVFILYVFGLFVYAIKNRLKGNEFPGFIHILYFLISLYFIIHPLYFYINAFYYKLGLFLYEMLSLNLSIIILFIVFLITFIIEIKLIVHSS